VQDGPADRSACGAYCPVGRSHPKAVQVASDKPSLGSPLHHAHSLASNVTVLAERVEGEP
jgi:hypothetical protein